MYKITFGDPAAPRGIEYASRVNEGIIAALWGHNATADDVVFDGPFEGGGEEYTIYPADAQISVLAERCKP